MEIDDIIISPHIERQSYAVNETRSTIKETRKNRKYLKASIIILIFFILISIAGLIIGIYILVSNATRPTFISSVSTATHVPTNTKENITTGPICRSSPPTSYKYSSTSPPQCSNYTNNTDETRHIDFIESINYCDNKSPFNNKTSVWIRFGEPAGRLIANSLVPSYRCGTVATGWYAGRYPPDTFSTSTSIICFNYMGDPCKACDVVSITKCGDFYVFLLPETKLCNFRYCTL